MSRSRASAILSPPRSARARWEEHASNGRIPYAWLDDPGRRFVRYDGAESPTPWTSHAADAFAEGVQTVLVAEQLALAVSNALAHWGWPHATRVAWSTRARADTIPSPLVECFGDPPPGLSVARMRDLAEVLALAARRAGPSVFEAMARAVRDEMDRENARPPEVKKRAGGWSPVGMYGAQWRVASRLGLEIPAAAWPPLAGRSLQETPDPFGPLSELTATGARWLSLGRGEVRVRCWTRGAPEPTDDPP